MVFECLKGEVFYLNMKIKHTLIKYFIRQQVRSSTIIIISLPSKKIKKTISHSIFKHHIHLNLNVKKKSPKEKKYFGISYPSTLSNLSTSISPFPLPLKTQSLTLQNQNHHRQNSKFQIFETFYYEVEFSPSRKKPKNESLKPKTKKGYD